MNLGDSEVVKTGKTDAEKISDCKFFKIIQPNFGPEVKTEMKIFFRTNKWMALFNGENQDNSDIAAATCGMLLSTLNDLVPGANMAGEMCQCMMENIMAVGKFSNSI